MSTDTVINRHDLISHFYSEDFLNEQGRGVLETLKFTDFHEAMQWLVSEFTRVGLDWRILRAGSPYPISLPNVVRNIEDGANTTLEDEIQKLWNNLPEENKTIANNNFKRIFGFPELVQGKNKPYCRLKYKNWLLMRKND